VDVRILGPLEVLTHGAPAQLGAPRQRALLALMAINANELVAKDRLVDELWGESPPASAGHAVEVYVSRLRKVLGHALRTQAPGYVLALDPDELDSRRFERLLEEGRRANAEASAVSAAALLREALALWRGAALADFAYEPFAQTEIARLDELRLVGLEERIEADLVLGRFAELVPELEALVVEHPLRERLRAALMLALYRDGRQAGALALYEQARRTLVEELGLEPGPQLRRLQQGILRQDADLDLAGEQGDAERISAARKLVTVVFAQVEGAAVSGDPEAFGREHSRLLDMASRALKRHGATVEKPLGGSVMGVFGVPAVREDDALRALRATLELRAELPEAQVGICTGEALVASGGVMGEAVQAAAQLQRAAAPGEILVAEPTAELVRDAAGLAPRWLDGRKAWALLEVSPHSRAVPRRLDASLVGRVGELELLRRAFARCVRKRRPALVTVVGEAGIGKSRLARELTSTLEKEALVLRGRCLAYGEEITLSPLREIVEQAVRGGELVDLLPGDEDADVVAARVAAAIGAGARPARIEDVFWSFRRLFEALARGQPLVLVLDDVHWAEPTLLDLLEHVTRQAERAPLFVLCLARPELLEERPSWSGDQVALEPLSDGETAELVATLLAGRTIGDDARSRILDWSAGNPLFVEQVVAMAAEDPARAPVVPTTLQALLTARLDRLGPGERAALAAASVAGREARLAEVEELLPEEARPAIRRHLDALVRKNLLVAVPSDDGAYRFRHVLILEAAYRALPKQRRAELHEQFAELVEQSADMGEPDETVGYHLERAHRFRAELGEDRPDLAAWAAARLAGAGERALRLGDAVAAVSLLERSLALMESGDVRRARLLPLVAQALKGRGELGRAEAVWEEAIALGAALGDRRLEALAALGRANIHSFIAPGRETEDEYARTIADAIAIFEELGDAGGLAAAWHARGFLASGAGLHGQAGEALELALEHARRAGDEQQQTTTLSLLAVTLWLGPTPVEDALRRCRRILREVRGYRAAEAAVLGYLAVLAAMGGRIDEARRLAARGIATYRELGQRLGEAVGRIGSGWVEVVAGDPAAAEREWRAGYDALVALDERAVLPTMAANLAVVVAVQGRHTEALELSELSERLAGGDDFSSQLMWRVARAHALAGAGAEVAEAERLARAAVELGSSSDAVHELACAWEALADVLAKAGRDREARHALEQTFLLLDQKGNVVEATRIREQMRS
jgi:predicted ATPase/DNA-binding SARP family transcriptional activator